MVDGIITGTTVPCFACQKWSDTTNQTHVKSTTAVLFHQKKPTNLWVSSIVFFTMCWQTPTKCYLWVATFLWWIKSKVFMIQGKLYKKKKLNYLFSVCKDFTILHSSKVLAQDWALEVSKPFQNQDSALSIAFMMGRRREIPTIFFFWFTETQ